MAGRARTNSVGVVVVGGGHAGCEAAAAAARLGVETILVTLRRDTIGEMSCNPAIGGLAKGQMVREVDALGGLMGVAADAAGIQFRMLNLSKGPAVRAPRAQQDKKSYRAAMLRLLEGIGNLEILEAEVTELLAKGGKVEGVATTAGSVNAGAVVLTTGTFINGLIHIGERTLGAGRMGEQACARIGDSLASLGLRLGRLKTGTPPRLRRGSIDFAAFGEQPGDARPTPFSFLSGPIEVEQVPCHIGYTNAETHDIIRSNIDRSPLYSGRIVGIGPRYCPSIEDKVVKFPDRDRHQLFLEPEERDGESVYLNGVSSSMPEDVQLRVVRSIAGLERAEFIRPGYAIEYHFLPPTQMRVTLECKALAGLYCAGQINGTSGYEEAAGQGLVAGANAALAVLAGEPMVLERGGSYIGVMIDDLITRGVDEPYRMFTSRAENRLQLRADNADRRLTPLGRRHGLVDDGRWEAFEGKLARMERAKEYLGVRRVATAAEAESLGLRLSGGLRSPASVWELLRRPEISLANISASLPELVDLAEEELLSIETDLKYEGYVRRQREAGERARAMERERLPEDIDFGEVPGLTREGVERLQRTRPETLGQASRVPGVTPAAVMALAIELRRRKGSGDG